MVFAVVVHDEAIELPTDQGTLAGDLRVLTDRVVALLGTPAARQALPGLLADLRGDPLLAKRFHASFIEAERQLIESLLRRSVRRGELTEQPDPADVHAQLLGTETRGYSTDSRARRRFAVYWALIRPASGLVRRDMLATVRRRATPPP